METIILLFFLLSGYGFWLYKLLRFIGWSAKKLDLLQSEAE